MWYSFYNKEIIPFNLQNLLFSEKQSDDATEESDDVNSGNKCRKWADFVCGIPKESQAGPDIEEEDKHRYFFKKVHFERKLWT